MIIGIEFQKDGIKRLSVNDIEFLSAYVDEYKMKKYRRLYDELINDVFYGSKGIIGAERLTMRKYKINADKYNKFTNKSINLSINIKN